MPTSRKRHRPRKTRKIRTSPQPSYWDRDRRQVLEETRPWIETMFAVDDAERRGDATEALRLMSARVLGPDGSPFWRPCRVNRLTQIRALGPALPAWGVSRWIAAQALDHLGAPGDPRRNRCVDLALEVRGGLDGLSVHGDQDALCKLVDTDWVYRQLFLYELGCLSHFVRRVASPDLLAGADHIHDWSRAPMSALRLVERTAATVTWEYVASGERVELPNVGSAAMVALGEHVLGRLVPVEGGVMLEAPPLVVPERTARAVAGEPSDWMDAVTAARDEINTAGFEHGPVCDVRQTIWQLVLVDPGRPLPAAGEFHAYLARQARGLARECLDGPSEWEPDAVDPWACLRAAVLHPGVLTELASVAGAGDVHVFERLTSLLAPPADVVCRDLVAELRDGAA
jgi:hypothetical protein